MPPKKSPSTATKKTAPAAKKVVKKARPAPSAKTVEAAAQIVAQAATSQSPRVAFEVLSPFKLRGVRLQPPFWIELTTDEAEPYQVAGLLGTEASLIGGEDTPDVDTSSAGTSNDTTTSTSEQINGSLDPNTTTTVSNTQDGTSAKDGAQGIE